MNKIGTLMIYCSIIVSVFLQKDSNYNIMGYIFIIAAFVVLAFKHLLNKQRIDNKDIKIISLLLISTFIIQLISTFKFGISNLFSMLSAYILIIFSFIYVFIKKNFIDIICKICILWNIIEVIVVMVYLKNYGLSLNFNNSLIIRQSIPIWPNYFAMISAIKVGLYYYTKNKNKTPIILSIYIIIISQSRTALIMIFVIFVINTILGNKLNNTKKVILITILMIVGVLGWNIISNSKGAMENNSISHTMESRNMRWLLVENLIKENKLVGIGFRSTTYMIEENTGVSIGSSHNDYIDNLLRGGIVYFIVFYGLVLLSLKEAIKNKKYSNLSIIASILLAGFTQNPLKNLIIQMIFIFIFMDSFYTNLEEV